eukprot:361792-Prorocentrum_minimum.AAC.3
MQGHASAEVDGGMLGVPEYTLEVEGRAEGGSDARVSVKLPGLSSSKELEVEMVQGRCLEVRCPNR